MSRRAFLTSILLLGLAAPSQAASPWDLLENLRNGLQRSGPTTARFVQTYIPAGFTTGDEETGALSLWLPDCLRWSYNEPAEKNFLVCQNEVYAWNEGEAGGRRYTIDPQREPGLDLLLVDVSTLRSRYVASSKTLDDGSQSITLETPPSAEGSYRATLRLDASLERISHFEYTDEEGNLSRFVISGYEALRHTALFQAPSEIEWVSEQ